MRGLLNIIEYVSPLHSAAFGEGFSEKMGEEIAIASANIEELALWVEPSQALDAHVVP